MAEGNFFPGPTEEEIIIALGYTPENVANKATDFSVINDTKYPTTEATNNQIIASLSSVSSYFFYKTASDIATYYQMTNVAPTGSSQSFTGTGLAVGEHVLASFATNSGYPNKTFYPSGWTTGRIHAEKAGGGVVSLRMDTYKRAVGGTETLICSSDLSTTLTTSPTAYNFDAYNATLDALLTSDRIVTKVVAVVASGTPNVTIYVEDAYLSRTNLPVQQTSYSDYFYNGVYASKPDPSTLADGITAWFTDKPDSNGGSFVVRSTATPGTKIWDRVGGGPVVIDSWANLQEYASVNYAGCKVRVTNVGVNGSDWGVSSSGALYPLSTRILVARNEYPTICAPSGTINTGTSGQYVSGVSLPRTYSGGAWVHFRQAGSTPNLDGLYFCVFSNATTCTIYSNGPGSAALNITAGGAYTGDATGAYRAAVTWTIPAGLLSTFGGVDCFGVWSGSNSGSNKGWTLTLGSTNLGGVATSGTTISSPVGGVVGFRNQGSAALQVGGARGSQTMWNTAAAATYATENTANALTIFSGPGKSGAADYSIIETAELWLVR